MVFVSNEKKLFPLTFRSVNWKFKVFKVSCFLRMAEDAQDVDEVIFLAMWLFYELKKTRGTNVMRRK